MDNGDPWSIKSNVIENWVTVCGAETIALTDAAPYVLDLEQVIDSGSTQEKSIEAVVYSKWFTLGVEDPNASPKCIVDQYSFVTKNTGTGAFEELVAVDGYKVADIIAGVNSPLKINLSKL